MSTIVAGLTAIAAVLLFVDLLSSIKILAEYERAVVFRLGRIESVPTGLGVALVIGPFHRMVRISLWVEALEVRPQESSSNAIT